MTPSLACDGRKRDNKADIHEIGILKRASSNAPLHSTLRTKKYHINGRENIIPILCGGWRNWSVTAIFRVLVSHPQNNPPEEGR